MKKTMPGGLRRCSCLPWGSRRGDNIGTSARLPPKVAAWLILMMMLPRAWLDATLQLIERAQSGGHSCLHGIARSTDEHSEHDGYRVYGHTAGIYGFVILCGVCLQRPSKSIDQSSCRWRWAACPPACTSHQRADRGAPCPRPAAAPWNDHSPTPIPANFSSDMSSLTSRPPESSCKLTAAAKPSPDSSRAASPAATPGRSRTARSASPIGVPPQIRCAVRPAKAGHGHDRGL